MNTIALLINNEKEKTILEHFFQNIKYHVLVLKSNFTASRAISHSIPLCIICEIPANYLDNMYVFRLLSNHKNTKNIPIIAYGNYSFSAPIVETLYDSGVHLYYQRPLQTKLLLQDIQIIQGGESIKIKRYCSDISESQLTEDPKSKALSEKLPNKTSLKNPAFQSVKKEENALTIPLDELEAVELVMDPITTPEERIDIIINRVSELLAFPMSIIKILEVTQNDKTGADDLSKAIEADPVIVSTLLSVSNTVHFARRGNRISDVKEAIIRLGFVETKNIAVSLSVMNLFSNETKSVGFNRFEFWYHSLACGIVSEIVARKAGYPKPEIAFICGLLHDFGIILLDEFFHSFFIAIFSQTIKNKSKFVSEERHLWGMSHNTAVSHLFKNWNMPTEITNTIGQQDIFNSKQSIDKKIPASILVNVVGISNIIAKCFQFGKDCDAIVHPVNSKTLEIFNLSEGIDDTFINTCINRLNIYSEFFNLDRRFFSYPPQPEPDAYIINFIDHTKDIFYLHKYFFKTSGYTIIEEPSIIKIKTMEKQPHAIVHLLDNTTQKDKLETYLSIPKGNDTQTGQLDSFIPSIFISQDKQSDPILNSVKHAYCLPSVVDANLLNFIVEGLISQESIKEYHDLIGTNGSYPQSAKNLGVQYLDNQTVLINLQGVIRLNSFNEIKKCLIKMVEKKVPKIAIHIGEIKYIDKLMVNLLANFQKKTTENNCSLCFCSIGNNSPKAIQEHNVLKSIHVFNRESDVVTYFTN